MSAEKKYFILEPTVWENAVADKTPLNDLPTAKLAMAELNKGKLEPDTYYIVEEVGKGSPQVHVSLSFESSRKLGPRKAKEVVAEGETTATETSDSSDNAAPRKRSRKSE